MRIARHTASQTHVDAIEAGLAHAARGEGVEGRVCGAHCDAHCRSCGARGCQCACAAHCPDAPRMLTSDGAFPIEPLIAPLVFEMKRTGYFEPCYSCEGHAAPDGSLMKAPTVWFYCEEPAHLRVLNGGLSKLWLNAKWRVVLTHSDNDNPEPTFALEPAHHSADLGALQTDIGAIARAMPEMLRIEARALRAAV